jgi:fumarylacetoacetate (FAA) hydrolase
MIGREGRNIPPDAADEYIAGFTIMNDWSARDVQREEMKVGLGPAKGKDFATSLGPWLVTPDELADRREPAPARGETGARGWHYRLEMVARVDGKEISRGNLADLYWTFAEMIAYASRDCTLYPGDVIGSGTVGTGCLLELGLPWLEPGQVVELEVERLGVLRNRVGESTSSPGPLSRQERGDDSRNSGGVSPSPVGEGWPKAGVRSP